MMRKVMWCSLGFLLAAVAPAAAGERPLFDFRTEIPAPGGSVHLEARCAGERGGFACRAESRMPSGRGFQIEGRFRLAPAAPDSPEPARQTPNAPRWF